MTVSEAPRRAHQEPASAARRLTAVPDRQGEDPAVVGARIRQGEADLTRAVASARARKAQ